MSEQLWEAWIEFRPLGAEDATPGLHVVPGTRQATRDAILEWAQGITYAYLGDALNQILFSEE